MRKILALVLLALALPSIALAAKPSTSHGNAGATVRYVLRGTLWSYTAPSATANGWVTIHVTGANHSGKLLTGTDLTFALTAKTKFALSSKAGLIPKRHVVSIKDGTRGTVEFRGPLKVANTALMAALAPKSMTALAVFIRTG